MHTCKVIVKLLFVSIFYFLWSSIASPSAYACSVYSDGSSDSCPSGQVCKNTTNCFPDPNGKRGSDGTVLSVCGNGACQATAQQNPQPPAQNPPAQPNPGQLPPGSSGASCMKYTDGRDTCSAQHPNEQCINTQACTIAGGGGLGSDGTPLKICGGGQCALVAKTEPKANDACTRNVLDPVGSCGPSLICDTKSCSGDGLTSVCSGTCQERKGNNASCTYEPSKGKQGDCKAGYLCKASANCSSLYCRGACAPAAQVEDHLTPTPPPSPPCIQGGWTAGQCTGFVTALGNLDTDSSGFTLRLFSILLSFSGGIALLLIIRAGFNLITSQGKPEQVQNGRDQLIAAIVGLTFLIFSLVLLEVIGYDILKIPGFGSGTVAPLGTCTVGGNQCTAGYTCQYSGSQGQCVKNTAGAKGTTCTVGVSGQCQAGLTCQYNGSGGTCQ